MHIMEGFLPVKWAVFWFIVFIPFLVLGLIRIRKLIALDKNNKLLLALCAAFIFVLSALKIPSVTGSCSHPTGVGLATVMFGPLVVSVLGVIVLLFQALLLAHGGITTLGANAMSMAVIGPMVGFVVYKLARKLNCNKSISIFLCAMTADLATYLTTSVQLGVVFPDPASGMMASILKFMAIFCVTQVPIAIAEGLLTVVMYNLISKNLPEKVAQLR
ncbi:energy-coupling factor ABC transporter permease [Listeria monocytogenes]|nr:energy-coupling factor ABC transporter permease [Listeria monocytogenes]EBH4269730.1 energy-coupling factor ABC transporter permease [Listeria monocytogenes]